MLKKSKVITVFIIFGIIFVGLYISRHHISTNTMTTTTDEFELFLNGELSLAQISERHAQNTDNSVYYNSGLMDLVSTPDTVPTNSQIK
jgi:hypothetical protein